MPLGGILTSGERNDHAIIIVVGTFWREPLPDKCRGEKLGGDAMVRKVSDRPDRLKGMTGSEPPRDKEGDPWTLLDINRT